ncbi:maternal effect embryo arrest 18 [Tanacetum coccineum]
MVDNLLKLVTPFPLCNQLSVSSSSRSLFMTSSINIQHSPTPAAATASNQPSLLVFSGGTAFNGVVEELKKLTTSVAHVLPVSDDGGSGPAVGDIRSRCLRLSDQSLRGLAVRTSARFCLPLDALQSPRLNRYSIVEGEHPLWKDVSKPYRETIRAFLAYFQNQILRRTNESFSFSNGSIGNFFFAGARIFFQSLDAAIFLFSRVSQIPTERWVNDLYVVKYLRISHPASGSLQLIDKGNLSALPSMIKRVFYMHEVFPTVNPSVLEQLRNVDCIIYGMGSFLLHLPLSVLLGVGEIISSRSCAKWLLASCFVTAITDALNRTYGHLNNSLKNNPSQYINTIFVPKDGQIPVDIKSLAAQGIVHVLTYPSNIASFWTVGMPSSHMELSMNGHLVNYTGQMDGLYMGVRLCKYKDEVEKEMRFKIFSNNVAYVEAFNAGNRGYKLSVNEFADQTNEEFKAIRNGFKFPTEPTSARTASFRYEDVTAVPSSMDWRKKGAVTPIKNQGQCGKVLLGHFRPIAATEGITQISTGKLISLSEQELVDCDRSGQDQGCGGGYMDGGFTFIVKNKGINTEAAYPYQAADATCNTKEEAIHAATITGHEDLYSSGVFNGTCGTELDHGVTAVGYGTTADGIKYWLVKNSWGTSWGEDGYIRMIRDVEAKEGICGIAMMASYPTA